MKKSIRTILQYSFFLSLGILFVWLSVKNISENQWNQIKDALVRARHWLIVPVILLLLLSHYSRAIRWKILMEPLGYQPSTFNTFAAVMIGYLVNSGVPRMGEVVKCTLLARYEKVRADKLIGTIVMERAVDMVSLMAVFAAALIYQGQIIGDYVTDLFAGFIKNKSGEVSSLKVIILVGGLFVILLAGFLLLRCYGHIKAVAKLKEVIKGVLHGLGSIRYVKHKGRFLFHSIFIWALYLASTTLGVYALQETASLGIGGGLTTLAVGSVGMILTPGGIGAYPLLVSKLMGLYGLDETTIGNTLGWLLWSVQTLIVLAAGLVLFTLFTYHNKKRQKIMPHHAEI